MFALPALEASAFVGFVFPGEIAVFLGGVLAYQGRVALWGAIVAAILGAVIGDSIGFEMGRRWGHAILRGTLGRLPLIGRHVDRTLERANAYLERRGPHAVVLGRFTAGLRVMVPGLAGMSRMPYPRFLLFNALGGTLWATSFVLLGFFAGAAWRQVESVASKAGLVLLALVVVGLVVGRLIREREAVRRLAQRLAERPPLAWTRTRFPRQVAWVRLRLDPRAPRGFPLTMALTAGALCAWGFGALTQDVVGHDDSSRWDPHVESFVLAHRAGALTAMMKAVTWLGSTAVLIPMVALVGGYFLLRRKDWRPLAKLAVALAGAVVLADIVKPLVGRPRPPARFGLGYSFNGWAFPSGHATQALAVWGMLAVILVGVANRHRALVVATAASIVLLVGASRVYLGAHWLTDVLGGYALGGLWLCIVVTALVAGRAEPRDTEVRLPRAA
ncbi:MAG: bifunctional DedA family/phosphatase PAP2 family protein [Actinomycetota bacterium]|nr:bifunctional DedA family/phosphatase PAP2 family protein [Actinomycetota bacterium]